MERSASAITSIGLLLIISMGAVTFAQESEYTHYTITATFDPYRHTISGQEIVDYINDSAETLSAVYFWLLPNYDRKPNPYLDPSHLDALYPQGFDPAWMKIRSVTDAEGDALSYELLKGPVIDQTYSLEDTLLRVELPQPLPPGEGFRLTLEFTTKFPQTTRGDGGYHREVYTWRFGWYPPAVPAKELIKGEYLSSERPYYKFLLPAALYELTLTLPKDYRAVLGTDHQETIAETEEEVTIHAINAVPVRSIPLTLGTDLQAYEFPHPEIPIVVYYLPGHEAAARLIASYAAESLDYYRERWGAYPHRRLLIAETPSYEATFAGASADALILLNRLFFDEKDLAVPGMIDRLLDYVLAHEIAHQWWGVGIGADLNAENFLSEAFAQYLAITYYEEKYGAFGPNVFKLERQGLLEQFVESQLGYINLREHLQGELPYLETVRNRFDEAIIKPQQDVRFANSSGERIYSKGYLMLRALRGLIGEEKMDELLREAQERFLHRTLTISGFEALAEEISGQELEEFFELALHRDGDEEGRAPYVDYGIERVESLKKRDGTYEHRVFLFREGEIRLPVEVVLSSRTDEEESQIWRIEDQALGVFVMVFETQAALKEVEIDPKHLAPDVDRLNNSYVNDGLPFFNRKLKFIPTGENALPLDAYLIRFNPFYQTLEGGYLLDHRWWVGGGFAAFVKDLGRGNSISALVGLTGDGLVGELSWSKAYFSHPEVGQVGRFWEMTDQVELTFLRRPDATGIPSLDQKLGATGRMANVLGLDWVHKETLTQQSAWWVSLRNDPSAFTRIELRGRQSIRLAPQIYFSGQLSFGWGEGKLGIFHFDLRELSSFEATSGYPYVGKARLIGSLALTLPLEREMNFNLLSVAMLHRVEDRFYIRFGNSWERLEQVEEGLLKDAKAEIGAELILRGATLGGLFPWRVTFGITMPISPLPEGERQLKQYLNVWVPLF